MKGKELRKIQSFKKTVQKKCALLMCFMMFLAAIVSYMPVIPAYAWEGNPYSSLVNTTTSVRFNNMDWYIIEDNSTAPDAGTLTLLAKECVGTSPFDSNKSNVYKGSTVETYLNTYYNSNFADVDSAILSVTPSNPEGNTAKLYLLSKSEAKELPKDVRMCNVAAWWLRSLAEGTNGVECVNCQAPYPEYVGSFGSASVDWEFGVRPALQLNLSSVVYSPESSSFVLKPDVSLDFIRITEAPAKTQYKEGEKFDPTGMIVSAYYTDKSSKEISGYKYTPNGNLSLDDKSITISYTEEGITRTTEQNIEVSKSGTEPVPSAATLYVAVKGKVDAGNEIKSILSTGEASQIKKYTSSDKKIAGVTKKGIVTGKKSGTVTITAYVKNGKKYEPISSVEVVVTKPVFDFGSTMLTSIDEPLSLLDFVQDLPKNTPVSWSVPKSKAAIAVVDGDQLYAAGKSGTVTVTCTIGEGKLSVKYKAKVKADMPPYLPKETKVKLNKWKTIKILNVPKGQKVNWMWGSDNADGTIYLKSSGTTAKVKVTSADHEFISVVAEINGVYYKTDIIVE